MGHTRTSPWLLPLIPLICACPSGSPEETTPPTPSVTQSDLPTATPSAPPTPSGTATDTTAPPPSEIFAERPGDPAPFMDPALRPRFDRGKELMTRALGPEEGLGPTFNADTCGSCHQIPTVGGSSPRYRDFLLVFVKRSDGALIPAGSNGVSPVRNLYASAPPFVVPEAPGTVHSGRRNAPPGFGVGLFAFVESADILANADPEDADQDGISGRPNYEQGRVGRFGVKAQATSLESFNRGAALNQMGLTTDPIFYVFPEAPTPAPGGRQGASVPSPSLWERLPWRLLPDLFAPAPAHAQVSAPDSPTLDSDGVPDPELSDADQTDILIFTTYLGAPPPSQRDAASAAGAALFKDIGCAACHLPSLPSTVGALPAYTDLLIHDMGPDLDDGVIAGLATGAEFRTQPLWGVALHGPFLHDGRADTLEEAILWHGGEGAGARDRFAALEEGDQAAIVAFLGSLGGREGPWAENARPGGDPPGDLTGDALASWGRGKALFQGDFPVSAGLGPRFNGDSCRACHQEPGLGGAEGLDTNVLRYGERDPDSGAYLRGGMLFRGGRPDEPLDRLPDWANVVELRSPPSLFGAGAVDGISDADILAGADPDDLDGDGISGRGRILSDGRLGRFGWKAQIPTVADFVADALFTELGLTLDPALSAFTGTDGDEHPDPELPAQAFADLTLFMASLPPPPPGAGDDAGAALFAATGCAACHTPSLGGIPLYSDLLLHDVADPEAPLVEQDPGVGPREFRTPPLWGVGETAPYLHDGGASSLEAAILKGHRGEAEAARAAFLALEDAERAALIAFLEAL